MPTSCQYRTESGQCQRQRIPNELFCHDHKANAKVLRDWADIDDNYQYAVYSVDSLFFGVVRKSSDKELLDCMPFSFEDFAEEWAFGAAQTFCHCGSGEYSEPQYDGHGIYLCKTCEKCNDEKMKKFRSDIREAYECDEPIDYDY